MKRFIRIISLIMAFTFALCACGSGGDGNTTAPQSTAAPDGQTGTSSSRDRIKFTMENGGSFVIELYPEYAPDTCDNFKRLVESGFYDGLTFHRIVDGFMAQGGDGSESAKASEAEPIYGEFASNGFSQNTLLHTRGVVSMTRSSDPNSASSQFFICYDECSWLDGEYAAFGKVIEGMETVDDFCKVERVYSNGELAMPKEPIRIAKAEVLL